MRNGNRTIQMFSIISASSNRRLKVKLSFLIGCPRQAQPSPINANSSLVKRCALPYGKGATVNLSARGSRRTRREGLRTMGRDGKGSRIITVRPHLCLGTLLCRGSFLQYVCVCICALSFVRERTVERRRIDDAHKWIP